MTDAPDNTPSRTQPPPFWRNTALIGFLGALIAAVPPVLTGIQQHYQTEREVRLNTARYQHERTLSYLDRALSPTTTEAKQAQVLRFLRFLPEDDPIRRWAELELPAAEAMVVQLRKEIEQTEQKIEAKRAEIDAGAEQVAATIATASSSDEVDKLTQSAVVRFQEQERELQEYQQHLSQTKVRIGEAPPGWSSLPSAEEPPYPSLWRLQVAVRSSYAEALEAARVIRERGGDPELYRYGQRFYVFVGRYGTRHDAAEHIQQARAYLAEGALIIDTALWCRDAIVKTGYTQCRI